MDYTYLDKMTGIKPTILLMRHAERYEIHDLRNHKAAMLTEEGKNDSYLLGRRLANNHKQARIYHSSVPRCKQTAEYIYKGIIDSNIKGALAGALPWLGGDYIIMDRIYINEYIHENGSRAFLRSWFENNFPREIITPAEEIAAIEFQSLVEQLKKGKSLIIDITHDWNITIMLEYYLKLRHEDIGIPAFLDYMIIYGENGKMFLNYRGHSAGIAI